MDLVVCGFSVPTAAVHRCHTAPVRRLARYVVLPRVEVVLLVEVRCIFGGAIKFDEPLQFTILLTIRTKTLAG